LAIQFSKGGFYFIDSGGTNIKSEKEKYMVENDVIEVGEKEGTNFECT
jgi:hypothetical protein